jgi:hypothetical protein
MLALGIGRLDASSALAEMLFLRGIARMLMQTLRK